MFGLHQQLEKEKDETKAIDNLISKELLKLSLGDRNALEEEVHGVRCLAREETPELIQSSLQKLAMVLENDAIIPKHKKQAYLQSQRLPMTYINGNDFRLRFLRLTLFDVGKAAKRMVRFLELACWLFGDYLLERPVRLRDFDKKDLQFIRNGSLQFLPFRDRSGRRICVCMNPITYSLKENKAFLDQSMADKRRGKMFLFAKVFLYISWVAGEDVDTQRKGLVIISWFDPLFNIVQGNRLSAFVKLRFGPFDLTSVRACSFHCCVPDTIFHRFVTTMMRIRVGSPVRLKMKVHSGESVELLYALQSYGIPTVHIPISFSGTIKTGYMKQWIRAREAKESTLYLKLANRYQNIIECPQLSDVLFRQGISLLWNPGNAWVRTLIEKLHKKQEVALSNKKVKQKRREMVLDIIKEISQFSRFLVWNEGGWWNELFDRELLILKIQYLIKEVRKSKREASQEVKVNSSTFIFHNSNKRPKLNESGGNNETNDASCFDFESN